MKLRKDFKEKWVAALRSGKYKQGEGYLHNSDENTFCCLGVAAHAVCKAPLKILDGMEYLGDYISETGKRVVPKILKGSSEGSIPLILANMNDGLNTKKKGFKAIATWIEKNL